MPVAIFKCGRSKAAVSLDDFCGRMGGKVVLNSSDFRRELKISAERILGE